MLLVVHVYTVILATVQERNELNEYRIPSAIVQQCSGAVEMDCERSVGTVFQLPSPDAIYSPGAIYSPDAIYSRDEGKERRWLPSLVVCIHARSTCC
jgi:hypothetical protein